jgi:hypothetical protein
MYVDLKVTKVGNSGKFWAKDAELLCRQKEQEQIKNTCHVALTPLQLSIIYSHPILHMTSSVFNKKTVNLSHQNLTSGDLVRLSKEIDENSQHIATIKLGYNDLKDEGAKIVAGLLSQHRSITCLDLGFCQIGDAGIEALSASLTYNTSLRILYLSGNLITESGFKHLETAFSANRSLTALYLTGNTGRAEGAKHLAKGLRFNQSITKLFLNGNKIDKDGAASISATLIANHTITHLNLVSYFIFLCQSTK